MEKYIQQLLKKLKLELLLAMVLNIVAVVLGETDVIPNGVIVKENDLFMTNTIVIVCTILVVPLALHMFTLCTRYSLRRLNKDEALQAYHIWSMVRLVVLCLSSLFSVAVYYMAQSTSAVFCALIIYCVAIYCWPTAEKINTYMEEVDIENNKQ